ncbi:MAG: hypothetical protein JW801_17715 [Bacteroidales bacterium]|nr:hypothetical protein [Bacteroidales bacterium]
MKAIRPLLFIVTFLPQLLFSQALEEIEKQMVARNNIAQKTRVDYKYTNGAFSKVGKKTSLTQYNSQGNTIKVEYYNDKGVVTGTETYAYDTKGNRTLFERTGNSPYKKYTSYTSGGQILKESGFNGTEEFSIDYKYNSAGKLSEVVNSAGGQVRQKMIYTHSGNVSAIEIYIGGRTLSSKMKMTYDAKDNLTEEITYDLQGTELEKKNYKYNSDSRLTEETKYTKGKFYYRITNTYDSGMRLTSVSEESLSKKKFIKKEYNYDSEGNLSSYKWRRNPDEDFNIKKYTYNEKGVLLTEETQYPQSNFRLLARFSYIYN